MRFWTKRDVWAAGFATPAEIPLGDIYVTGLTSSSRKFTLHVEPRYEGGYPWQNLTEDEARWMLEENKLDNAFLKASYGLEEDVL